MRNQPVVGLLQLPEGYPYRSGSRRHIASMAAVFILNENVIVYFFNYFQKRNSYGLHLLQGTYPALIASSRVSK